MARYITLLILMTSISSVAQKRVEKLTFDYLDVALWEISEGKKHRLMKWTKRDKVRYRIVGEMLWLSEEEWTDFLDELTGLTGLNFEYTSSDNYDILIFFGPIDTYAELSGISVPLSLAQKFGNWGNRTWNREFELTRASFCIDPLSVMYPDYGVYRIKRSFLDALGILGTTSDIYSIFYTQYNGNSSRLSRADKRLVKLHYLDMIPTGVDLRELRTIVFRNEEVSELAYEKL